MASSPDYGLPEDARLRRIRERIETYRPAPGATTNRAIEDMRWLLQTVDDLQSRLANIARLADEFQAGGVFQRTAWPTEVCARFRDAATPVLPPDVGAS